MHPGAGLGPDLLLVREGAHVPDFVRVGGVGLEVGVDDAGERGRHHHALDSGALARVEHILRAHHSGHDQLLHAGGAEPGALVLRGVERRGGVVHRDAVADGVVERALAGQVAAVDNRQLARVGLAQAGHLRGLGSGAHGGDDLVPLGQQLGDQVHGDEAGGAGDADLAALRRQRLRQLGRPRAGAERGELLGGGRRRQIEAARDVARRHLVGGVRDAHLRIDLRSLRLRRGSRLAGLLRDAVRLIQLRRFGLGRRAAGRSLVGDAIRLVDLLRFGFGRSARRPGLGGDAVRRVDLGRLRLRLVLGLGSLLRELVRGV